MSLKDCVDAVAAQYIHERTNYLMKSQEKNTTTDGAAGTIDVTMSNATTVVTPDYTTKQCIAELGDVLA